MVFDGQLGVGPLAVFQRVDVSHVVAEGAVGIDQREDFGIAGDRPEGLVAEGRKPSGSVCKARARREDLGLTSSRCAWTDNEHVSASLDTTAQAQFVYDVVARRRARDSPLSTPTEN